ncbi:MAG: murein hydrolase activator EnvC family protein [Rhodospirillales bacterium]|tara:strand:+ start:1388 stop:2620 length:1233 start_codon:yes stop_codon:yes gene_type:complete
MTSKVEIKLLILGLFVIILLPSKILHPQESNKLINNQIKKVEDAIKVGKKNSQRLKRRAATLKNDLNSASQNRIKVARTVQNLERKLSELESEIRDLNLLEKEKKELLDNRYTQSDNVLMALQRISRLPLEAMVAYPSGTKNVIRTAILLRAAVPKIEYQAKQLREDLVSLAKTRKMIAFRKIQLDKAGLEFKLKRATLDDLIKIKFAEHEKTITKRYTAKRKVAKLASRAKNLMDLIGNLEEDKRHLNKISRKETFTSLRQKNLRSPNFEAPVNLKPFALARGSLIYPAAGRTSGKYGETVTRGMTRKGLEIETRASAQVVAPYGGKVVFVGNFRGYGQLLIIDHGEGYHTLLSGMKRIDGVMGQYLRLGEPIGIMGNPGTNRPRLYVELRRNNQPINPKPWLKRKKNT